MVCITRCTRCTSERTTVATINLLIFESNIWSPIKTDLWYRPFMNVYDEISIADVYGEIRAFFQPIHLLLYLKLISINSISDLLNFPSLPIKIYSLKITQAGIPVITRNRQQPLTRMHDECDRCEEKERKEKKKKRKWQKGASSCQQGSKRKSSTERQVSYPTGGYIVSAYLALSLSLFLSFPTSLSVPAFLPMPRDLARACEFRAREKKSIAHRKRN